MRHALKSLLIAFMIVQLGLTALHPCLLLSHGTNANALPFGGTIEICTPQGLKQVPLDRNVPPERNPFEHFSSMCEMCWAASSVVLAIAAIAALLAWPRQGAPLRAPARLPSFSRHQYAPFHSRAPPLSL